MKKRFFFLLLLALAGLGLFAPGKAGISDFKTKSSAPGQERESGQTTMLPKAIKAYLGANHYHITNPSSGFSKGGNVIRGEFFRRGGADWAVLVTRDGYSSILVFKDGQTATVDELGKTLEPENLQSGSKTNPFYQRKITLASKAEINSYSELSTAEKHDGIKEMVGKEVKNLYYYDQNQWRSLKTVK